MSELTTQKQPIAVGSRGVQLTSIEAAYRFSQAVVKSGLAPASFKTPEAVMIAIQYGSELGLAPMQSLQSIAVINGRPSVWGDGLVAIVRGSGDCEYIREWIEGDGDNRTAFCETKRKGEPAPVVGKFSVADAKKANLWQTQARVKRKRRDGGTYECDNDSPWYRHPERMLGMRARAFVLRDVYADHLRGIGIREEVMDYSAPMPEATVEPAPVRRLADIGTPTKADPEPEAAEPSGVYACLLGDIASVDDGDSDAIARLQADIASELGLGTITEDEAEDAMAKLDNKIPY